MPNVMMHAPETGNLAHTVNGRRYNGVLGSPQAVPDYDAAQLEANGWTYAGVTGTTAQRPTSPKKGELYADATLGKSIRWDGKTWRDPLTGAAV